MLRFGLSDQWFVRLNPRAARKPQSGSQADPLTWNRSYISWDRILDCLRIWYWSNWLWSDMAINTTDIHVIQEGRTTDHNVTNYSQPKTPHTRAEIGYDRLPLIALSTLTLQWNQKEKGGVWKRERERECKWKTKREKRECRRRKERKKESRK